MICTIRMCVKKLKELLTSHVISHVDLKGKSWFRKQTFDSPPNGKFDVGSLKETGFCRQKDL